MAVLLLFEDGAAHRRATYPGQAPGRLAMPRTGLIKFVVSEDVRPALVAAQADGTRLRLVNPLGFADVSCRNLWAAWNGDGGDFQPRLVISAHLDHIGIEYGGQPFPGGLDNASGVGLALSLIENFVRDQVAMDVALVLTDAEEVNLSGATAFVRQAPFPLDGLAVLNLDMVRGVDNLQPCCQKNPACLPWFPGTAPAMTNRPCTALAPAPAGSPLRRVCCLGRRTSPACAPATCW